MCFVYFVGNAVNFSEAILRAAAAEFSEIGFRRVSSLAEVKALEGDATANTLAIIVDEMLIDDFVASEGDLRAMLPNALFAIAYRGPENVRKLLIAPARNPSLDNVSFLPMNIQFDSWLSILRLILGGEGYVSRELLMPSPELHSMHAWDGSGLQGKQGEGALNGNLTEREVEVLSLVAEGKQNKTIAHDLGLSEHTVKLHIHHVIAKLGVRNRTEAAAWFFEHRSLLNMSFRK